MPVGFPTEADVTNIENIEPLPSSVRPLSEAILRLDRLLNDSSATDWGIKYRHCVKDKNDGNFLRGDVHTARCRVRDAYNRCLIKRNDINEFRKDVPTYEKYEANIEQVEGYLDIAIENFLSSAFDRFEDDTDGEDCPELKDELKEIEKILNKHRKAAQHGVIYEGPPVESVL